MDDFGVAAATLDNPDLATASAHIWTNSMRREITLDPDLPKHPGETPAFEAARKKSRKAKMKKTKPIPPKPFPKNHE